MTDETIHTIGAIILVGYLVIYVILLSTAAMYPVVHSGSHPISKVLVVVGLLGVPACGAWMLIWDSDDWKGYRNIYRPDKAPDETNEEQPAARKIGKIILMIVLFIGLVLWLVELAYAFHELSSVFLRTWGIVVAGMGVIAAGIVMVMIVLMLKDLLAAVYRRRDDT